MTRPQGPAQRRTTPPGGPTAARLGTDMTAARGDTDSTAARRGMGRIALAALVAAATVLPLAAAAATFQILPQADLDDSGLDTGRRDLAVADVLDAVAFWETNVTGYTANDSFLAGVSVEFVIDDIDGPGGTLGDAEIPFIYTPSLVSNGVAYASDALVRFDRSDLAQLVDDGEFYALAQHEIAHALGFGILWEQNGLSTRGTGRYTGPAALAAYRAEFDPDATSIPVERMTGDPGSDDSHWAEIWAGGGNELMTAFLDPPETISRTTLFSFRDLGYTTLEAVALRGAVAPGMTAVIPLPPAVPVFALALAAIFLRRRPGAPAAIA